ncbi:ATP-dependent DNA ligase [Salinigranum sp. GCM10025319]|uniref:ATP-dependent DNA ligase n=1 Tax=Salinigranum sp. GCM10025319 TaxID=3252687 RepID=UPI003612A587
MEFAALVETFDAFDATDSTLDKTALLAEGFAESEPGTLEDLVLVVQGQVFPSWDPADLGVSSRSARAAVAKATGVDEREIERRWGETGDLGDAAAWAVDRRTQQTLFTEPLTLDRVLSTLRAFPDFEGAGSQTRRIDELAGLVSDADPAEARYIVRLAVGHLRLGIGDGLVRDAIAAAFLAEEPRLWDRPPEDRTEPPADLTRAVERAFQVTNDYPLVARTAREEGLAGLADRTIEVGRPVQSMKAEKAESTSEAIESLSPADGPSELLVETKLDGMRMQVHVAGDDVTLYTRRLEDVTAQFPEVAAAVGEAVTAEVAVLDGEAVGYDGETGELVPFQDFSRRIKREYEVERLAEEIPATLYLFDALRVDDDSLLDAPLRERIARLESSFEPIESRVERVRNEWLDGLDGDGPLERTESFYDEVLAAGHEGVMLKNGRAPYQPGVRVGQMMKLKPVMEPLDLVVTRAERSEGRRAEQLGRLFLACYDPDTDEYREVGRLSTGYTDEELAALTERLETHATREEGRQVDLAPEVVLEVEYEELQRSTEYGSGYALRFPRFLRVRDDLAPTEADTIDRVASLYDEQ